MKKNSHSDCPPYRRRQHGPGLGGVSDRRDARGAAVQLCSVRSAALPAGERFLRLCWRTGTDRRKSRPGWRSSNYEVFSRSRLLLRLNDAGKQFAAAAGLPPDMNFMSQVAGSESALALYDIGKLQFVYITRLPSANAMQNQLWQTRAKFETRNAGGATFYMRRDPESQREVEFAVHENYLLLATREDLMASALQLMAGWQRQHDRSRAVVCPVRRRCRARRGLADGPEPGKNCAQPLFPLVLGATEYF